MKYFEDDRKKNIYNIVSAVKLFLIFLCAIVFYIQFHIKNIIYVNNQINYTNLLLFLIITSTIVLLFWLGTNFSLKASNYRNIFIIQSFENAFFIVIFTALIYISNSYISQYKFLFIFIIITSTIQSGIKYGMTMSLISSAIVLIIDLTFAPSADVSLYFESDLILVGVFILTAWVLGYYVKIDDENIEKKNKELEILNSELSEESIKRKSIEEMLFKNEMCYNVLIENSRDAIFVHREGKIIFVNESAAKLVGIEDTEHLSEIFLYDYTPKYELENIKEKFSWIYENKVSRLNFEEKLIKSNGEILTTQNTSVFFIYEGEATILSILRDITPEKQVEKLRLDVKKNTELLNETREFNKLIIELFSNVSHELKTPLNVIFAALQVLDMHNKPEGSNSEKSIKYIKIMKQNCYRLMRLINNLLDLTKLDSGFLKLNVESFNIVNIVEEIALSVVPYAESKGISLIFDTDVEEKLMSVDPDKIERIILNLLSNAIKFSSKGDKIEVVLLDKENYIEISVRDTGIGIPEDKLEVIFERFGQVEKTIKSGCEGTGIGLYLVKSFVQMHGGEISVKSKIGDGSEFIINMPVKIIEQQRNKEEVMYETNIEKISIEFSDIYS